MGQAAKQPWPPLSIVLLTILIVVGFFAILLHLQGDSQDTVILDFCHNWGLVMLHMAAVVNLIGGEPEEKNKQVERLLCWSLLILNNWGVWTRYDG